MIQPNKIAIVIQILCNGFSKRGIIKPKKKNTPERIRMSNELSFPRHSRNDPNKPKNIPSAIPNFFSSCFVLFIFLIFSTMGNVSALCNLNKSSFNVQFIIRYIFVKSA